MAVQETETGAAVFEIDRWEFADGRIELVGTWSGLRAQRFMRPTLVLRQEGEGEDIRLLADLEHKPWAAGDGHEWIAAFPWRAEPAKFASAELNVGSGLDLKLPPPRMRPGKPRRFKQRVVVFDAAREAAAAAKPTHANPGIVTEELEAKPSAAKPAASASVPAASAESAPAASGASAQPASPTASAPASTATAPSAAPDAPASPPADDGASARLESLRRELDVARSERDRAREQVRALRNELEAERQARERAVADARAAERESAGRMLAEGAELRAAIERQREMAYSARDEAVAARDRAIEARDRACAERDEAFELRKKADHDRDAAQRERDQANRERDRAFAARDKALDEARRADEERAAAVEERDTIVSIHERDLPIHPPQPRFAPREGPRSEAEIWAPRAIAAGILLLFAFVVLRLFAGG